MIKEFHEHQESPSLNGIIYPTGQIQLINFDIEWEPSVKFRHNLGELTSIKDLDAKNELEWSDCCILEKLLIESNNILILVGEASFGNDGFVAVIDEETKGLNWLAFFNCSNPFNKVEFKNGEIIAYNTYGNTWSFPLKKPADFKVDS